MVGVFLVLLFVVLVLAGVGVVEAWPESTRVRRDVAAAEPAVERRDLAPVVSLADKRRAAIQREVARAHRVEDDPDDQPDTAEA